MQKLSLTEITGMVESILEPGYRPKDKEKVAAVRLQVELFYPKLKHFLAPSGTEGRYTAPGRWNEPLTQYYIRGFQQLHREADLIRINNKEINTDRVYTFYLNPDVRKSMRERKMNGVTYHHLESLIQPTAKLSSSSSLILAQTSSTKLTINTEPAVIERLDAATCPVLAVESALATRTVQKYKGRSHKGNRITDFGFTLKDEKTSGDVVNRLMLADVDDWEGLVEAARFIGYSVRGLLRILEAIGSKSAIDVIGLIDDSVGDVADYAQENNVSNISAWHLLFQIFSSSGRGNIGLSLDILKKGSFLLENEIDVPEMQGCAPWSSGTECWDPAATSERIPSLHFKDEKLLDRSHKRQARDVETEEEKSERKSWEESKEKSAIWRDANKFCDVCGAPIEHNLKGEHLIKNHPEYSNERSRYLNDYHLYHCSWCSEKSPSPRAIIEHCKKEHEDILRNFREATEKTT